MRRYPSWCGFSSLTAKTLRKFGRELSRVHDAFYKAAAVFAYRENPPGGLLNDSWRLPSLNSSPETYDDLIRLLVAKVVVLVLVKVNAIDLRDLQRSAALGMERMLETRSRWVHLFERLRDYRAFAIGSVPFSRPWLTYCQRIWRTGSDFLYFNNLPWLLCQSLYYHSLDLQYLYGACSAGVARMKLLGRA